MSEPGNKSSYGRLERQFAIILSRTPVLKEWLKRLYQRINFVIHREYYDHKCNHVLRPLPFDDLETFFGYYDNSPANDAGTHIIYHATARPTRKRPCPSNEIKIILLSTETWEPVDVATSSAYNWQQGSKLQWLDNDRFVFNDYDADRSAYAARIFSVSAMEIVATLNTPIYDCHRDRALGLNFERLHDKSPDYGYRNNASNVQIDYADNNSDGIVSIDMKSNASKLILSIDDIIKLHPQPSMEGAHHMFNHIMIAPGARRFMFLHRWFHRDYKKDALIVADMDGSSPVCLADDGMVSHCTWLDEDTIVAYLRDENIGDNYYNINIGSRQRTLIDRHQLGRLGDGHPSVKSGKMLFDTYPDRGRYQGLFLYDLAQESLTMLGKFFHSFAFQGESRCDLHPRWSRSGASIFFDSVFTGKRQLYMLDFDAQRTRQVRVQPSATPLPG